MAILEFQDKARRACVIEVGEDAISLGRSPDNDLVIDSGFVSAHHARVRRHSGKTFIQDLGSHNGTFINGLRIKEAPLIDGDEVALADFSLRFYERSAQRVTFLEDASDIREERLLKSHVDSSPLVQTILGQAPAPESPAQGQPQASELLLFYRIIEIVNTAIELQTMLQQIMERVMELIPASRGYLLLKDEKSSEMVPMAIVDSESDAGKEKTISLSRTVCTKALEEKSAVLIEDALSMGDFNPSKSIVALNIRSAICSPLWHGEEITGLIYFDNRSFMLSGGFKHSHLDLLSAIGYQVALGIEKFKLVEKVRREEMLRANLQRYHSPDVIETIISHLERNEELLVQETEVTILFCDIVGFTKLAEKKEPIEVAQFLNEYLSIMTEIVFEHGGTLDKYIGDAIMAVFGAPVSKGEDARQAVLASLKMRDSIQRRMSFRHPVPFEVRVGINTGRVVAGNFGSLQRMEYTVIGDPVNVAARLESYSEPSRVLIGEATFNQVAHHFDCEFAGEYKVRGRQEPVKCWWVNGVAATETMPLDVERVPPTRSS